MKKKIKKQSKSILKVLIPDHLKRTNDNSEWCGTGDIFKKNKKQDKSILKKMTLK
jgi:hypothetical protein